MPPVELKDFFIATSTAAASFIGLLFVAISFTMNEPSEDEHERTLKRILAESSYAALLNIFFVSIVALIPGVKLGGIIFAMAWAGIGNSIHFLRSGPMSRHGRGLLAFATVVYVVEAIYGVSLWFRPDKYIVPAGQVAGLLILLFSLGLVRAWELTGIRREEQSRHRKS